MADDVNGEVALTPPLFVLFDDGTLWSFDAIDQVALGAEQSTSQLSAWDGAGHRIVLAAIDQGRVVVESVGDSPTDRRNLEELLRDRLLSVHVRDVDRLSFDELVFKASIRFVAPNPRTGSGGLLGALLDGLFGFLSRP